MQNNNIHQIFQEVLKPLTEMKITSTEIERLEEKAKLGEISTEQLRNLKSVIKNFSERLDAVENVILLNNFIYNACEVEDKDELDHLYAKFSSLEGLSEEIIEQAYKYVKDKTCKACEGSGVGRQLTAVTSTSINPPEHEECLECFGRGVK